MATRTLLVPFAAAGQENGGVKLSVPAQSVDPGEAVRIALWGASGAALAGYGLNQGSDGLGSGTLRRYDGQTEARLFDLDGATELHAFDWPVASLVSVVAVGQVFVAEGNAVRLIGLPGEDLTRFFRLSGNALARIVGGPRMIGAVRATAVRSPWCREWIWRTPVAPAVAGAADCDSGDEARDETGYWFFLLRFGVLRSEFSLTLADTAGTEDAFDFGAEPLLHFDAMDISAGDGDVLQGLTDRCGNQIGLSGSLRAWFVEGETEAESYEPYLYNGAPAIWESHTGDTLPWDGRLPAGARNEYNCASTYDATSHLRPCVRLETDTTKEKRWGLLWSGFGPDMVCRCRYSNSRQKTLFFVVSGASAYAIGRVAGADNAVPAGYSARERVAVALVGDTADPGADGTNFGAYDGTNLNVRLELTGQGVRFRWQGSGPAYQSLMAWYGVTGTTGSADSLHYAVQGAYPPGKPTLVTVEMDAAAERYTIFVNGRFRESLSRLDGAGIPVSFPTSALRFSAEVDHANTVYDTMGVQYETRLDVFTALLFDGLFTGAARKRIEWYLMERWGITADEACGWPASELDALFGTSQGLVGFYRGCSLPDTADLVIWPDESGLGHDLDVYAATGSISVANGMVALVSEEGGAVRVARSLDGILSDAVTVFAAFRRTGPGTINVRCGWVNVEIAVSGESCQSFVMGRFYDNEFPGLYFSGYFDLSDFTGGCVVMVRIDASLRLSFGVNGAVCKTGIDVPPDGVWQAWTTPQVALRNAGGGASGTLRAAALAVFDTALSDADCASITTILLRHIGG